MLSGQYLKSKTIQNAFTEDSGCIIAFNLQIYKSRAQGWAYYFSTPRHYNTSAPYIGVLLRGGGEKIKLNEIKQN